MEKAVMLSIHPKWVGKIVDGEKTIEIRKTKPKIETPFKCYIYHTSGGWEYRDHWCTAVMPPNGSLYDGSQRVIGEFVCDKVYDITLKRNNYQNTMWYSYDFFTRQSCLEYDEIMNYLFPNNGYGWHISDLIIYDEPKHITDFTHFHKCGRCNGKEVGLHKECDFFDEKCEYLVSIERPPQSWCYVEEKE